MSKELEIQRTITFVSFKVSSVNLSVSKHFGADLLNEIEVDIAIISGFSDTIKNSFTIGFDVSLMLEEHLKLNLQCIGIFESNQQVDDSFRKSHFVGMNAPAIVFPYVRSYISNLSLNSGLPSIVLPTYNFSSLKKD